MTILRSFILASLIDLLDLLRQPALLLCGT
jgi:hypothetical protein